MKIQQSALIANMAGKLNGSAIRRSRYGLVLQQKSNAKQGNGQAQGRHRAQFSFVSGAWRVIPELERKEWNNIAKTNEVTDRFGNNINLSGYAYFQMVQLAIRAWDIGLLSATDYNPEPSSAPSIIYNTDSSYYYLDVKVTETGSVYRANIAIVPKSNETRTTFPKNAVFSQTKGFSSGIAEFVIRKTVINAYPGTAFDVWYWVTSEKGYIGTKLVGTFTKEA